MLQQVEITYCENVAVRYGKVFMKCILIDHCV